MRIVGVSLLLVEQWLATDLETYDQAQTHTLPTVVRMDIMARRVGPGKVGPFLMVWWERFPKDFPISWQFVGSIDPCFI